MLQEEEEKETSASAQSKVEKETNNIGANNDNTVDDEDDDQPLNKSNKKKLEFNSMACPYLDTVDRSQLDFDFEKICSVSLSDVNIYACLICGKYFQGQSSVYNTVRDYIS